ncbi:hypothetical protein [uncultured Desulfovibrio sp.]|uniref:Uncharacterized protein n=1 Tax=Candidatus Desulfovibrio intestinavium TaxID=2838534 RepID=A0A9D2KRC6_9BACT|nr:hypothetical protein [uncultured Desulfovibrio sp.]HJA78241.1 hypothetical protein [Candidatus Desulfovibrio intestinavium]
MKDALGLYYHPQAGNPGVRVYVRREADGGVAFRLWRQDLPEAWERHGWVPYAVLESAARLYREERNPDADPLRLYDIRVAQALLQEEGQ